MSGTNKCCTGVSISCVKGAPPQADRDWNPAILLLTNHGAVFVYSLPDLKQCYRKTEFLNPGDRK